MGCVCVCENTVTPPKFSGSSIFVITFLVGISMWGHNPFSHKPLSKSSPMPSRRGSRKMKNQFWSVQVANCHCASEALKLHLLIQNGKSERRNFQISTGHDSWEEQMTNGKEDCSSWMMLNYYQSSIFMSSTTSIPWNYHRIRSMTPMVFYCNNPHIAKNCWNDPLNLPWCWQ